MNDDGHGPQYGCTYVKCGNPGTPCPFVKDEAHVKLELIELECKHEWRQLVDDAALFKFYCIHCLTITTT